MIILYLSNTSFYLGDNQAFNQAIKIDPNYAKGWYYKGNSLRDIGKYEEGIEAINKAIEIDPKYAHPYSINESLLEIIPQKFNTTPKI
jgi:tetratricopeptide (TPR) repeat protein